MTDHADQPPLPETAEEPPRCKRHDQPMYRRRESDGSFVWHCPKCGVVRAVGRWGRRQRGRA